MSSKRNKYIAAALAGLLLLWNGSSISSAIQGVVGYLANAEQTVN